jgi:L-fuculose-phosphate aldolase
MSISQNRKAMVEAGARLAAAGLVPGGAGNLSVRDGDRLLITARGARLAALSDEDLVVCDLDGQLVDGDRMPSSETPLHCAAYAATGAGAVVHTHALFCTVVSTLAQEIAAVHYAVSVFGGSVRVANYATFGTEELAQTVSEALKDRRGALMRNHGAVTVASELEEAVELAETLEWLASVHYYAHLAGTPSVLTAEQLAAVQQQRSELPEQLRG